MKLFKRKILRCGCTLTVTSIVLTANVPIFADGVVIDRIYNPYVQALETEIEWRSISQSNKRDFDDSQLHKFGIGQSINDIWSAEIYLIGERNENNDLGIDAIEIESKLQLTEQGEYAADWGILFELERSRLLKSWEIKTGLLTVKEWGRWIGTSNIFAIYEWGDNFDSEFETKLALQLRYRYSRRLEPAIEFHTGQNNSGMGPLVMGTETFDGARKLNWELGFIFGLNGSDHTLKASLEYEF
jgi:hypothetical protein